MSQATGRWTANAAAMLLLASCILPAQPAGDACADKVVPRLRMDARHPWRPPFGLDRIGRPVVAVVELSSDQRPMRDYFLAGYRAGKEVERHALNILSRGKALFGDTVEFRSYPDQLALFSSCRYQGQPLEIARTPVQLPDLEADAVAAPGSLINPVDLGAILPPHNWLLVARGQKPTVTVAAISRRQALDARVRVWFQSTGQPSETPLPLQPDIRATRRIQLPPVLPALDRDVLHIAIVHSGGTLWKKDIPAMFFGDPPPVPSFGAVATRLRYDPPISVREATGRYSTLDYRTAWDPTLQDVVVFLPNGSRFVFWRGSSYIPFWAGRHNTGFSYEWAETTPPPDGFVDSVEPLMDKELRYSRVQIVESSAARVHVRWTYQSTDFQYKIWGDSAVEDYYFYPDGFGTRVLTLRSKPAADYELSEFIVLTPQSAYPLEVLPASITELLYLDGEKVRLPCPYPRLEPTFQAGKIPNPRNIPIVFRNHIHKEEAATAIYFCPGDTTTPIAFQPFHDRGYLVTPTYWGSHWPLGRGKSTGWSIDDRIDSNPAHNSVMTWGLNNRPTPLHTAEVPSLDTLGVSKTQAVRRWAWLIAMTDITDVRLLDWAGSFSRPPSLELAGARLDFEAYVPERRALRIHVDNKTATLQLKPVVRSVNPVIEIVSAPGNLAWVTLDGRRLDGREYAWDGKTLWLNATFDRPAEIGLRFE